MSIKFAVAPLTLEKNVWAYLYDYRRRMWFFGVLKYFTIFRGTLVYQKI